MTTCRKKPGRPNGESVREDCRRIAEVLAGGEGEFGIRVELGLSRRAYRHRMRLLRKTAVDRHFLWAKFVAITQAQLRQLGDIEDAAMKAEPPQQGVAISCIMARGRLWRGLVEMGQLLGVYTAQTAGKLTRTKNYRRLAGSAWTTVTTFSRRRGRRLGNQQEPRAWRRSAWKSSPG